MAGERREFGAEGLGDDQPIGFKEKLATKIGGRITQPDATTIADQEAIPTIGDNEPFVRDALLHHVFSLAGRPIARRKANVSDGPQG